jgi:hypothetical protein
MPFLCPFLRNGNFNDEERVASYLLETELETDELNHLGISSTASTPTDRSVALLSS